MKIGFDAKRYFANYTGLGNYSRSLLENLVKYHPDNQYILYTHQFDPDVVSRFQISESQVSIRTPASLLGRLNSSIWRSLLLSHDLALETPDIYHGLSHEIPVGIQKIKELKTVVTIHDLIFLRYPEYYRAAERAIYTRKFKYSCQHADRIVSVSEQTKKDIVQYFGTPEEKIETIYQSCDPSFGKIVPEILQQTVKDKYGLPHDFILYVGSFNERKNLTGLIDGLTMMNKSLDTPLVMIGGGKQYKAKVMEQIHRSGLDNRVMIRSDVPNEDLPAIYQSAKLFVYPSIFEGFGIPIIEAISSKVPVITTQGGCFTEAGGPSTCYVDPTNPEDIAAAMEQILTDSELTARMIADGLEYIGRFHRQETSKQLIHLYQNLTA